MSPILLVEDSPDDVLFVRRAMSKAGITNPLHIATNGDEAVQYFTKLVKGSSNAPCPCLVLLDLQLPQIKGLDVLKWIREHPEWQTLIVIIHSSSHLETEIERAYQLGANSFLVKTSSGEELVRMMSLVKAYWLELNVSVSKKIQASSHQ
jgi:CheY-like chemotaxis protein